MIQRIGGINSNTVYLLLLVSSKVASDVRRWFRRNGVEGVGVMSPGIVSKSASL